MIPYGRQDIQQSDIDAVTEVLRSDFLTQGPVVPRFEGAVAEKVNAKFGVAANSATSSLHVACLALGVSPGDLLWTVPNTFVASANCGRYCGADVDFVDIDRDSWNISIPALKAKLSRARKSGRMPRVLVPVHFTGQPPEQKEIKAVADENGIRIIEDASHAIGASADGEPVGSCRWSDITVFSFHPVKIITTGEGGMGMTNDPELAERMRMFRSHGITREAARFELPQGDDGAPSWYYEQQMLGYNYRMTEIQAVLGLSQVRRLSEYVSRRNAIARRYDEQLKDLPLELPVVRRGAVSAFHLYVVRLAGDYRRKTHRRVFDGLRDRGIGVNLHYMPVHLQPYYRRLGFKPGQFPEAEAYADSAISLPLYPTLTESEQGKVVEALKAIL
jgi:UDP-4-amino-4,6-dideoxy-N-acetyl-beta-L-altrosamine transaminase